MAAKLDIEYTKDIVIIRGVGESGSETIELARDPEVEALYAVGRAREEAARNCLPYTEPHTPGGEKLRARVGG